MVSRGITVEDAFYAGFYRTCLSIVVSEPESELSESLKIRAAYLLGKTVSCNVDSNSAAIQASLQLIEFLKEAVVYTILSSAKSGNQIAQFIAACVLCYGLIPNSFPKSFAYTENKNTDQMKLLRLAQFMLIDRYDLIEQSLQSTHFNSSIFSKLAENYSLISTGQYLQLIKSCSEIENIVRNSNSEAQSILLKIQKAVGYMHLRQFQEALFELSDIDPSVAKKSEDVLANLITCCSWLNKTHERNQYFKALVELNPNHQIIVNILKIQNAVQTFSFKNN